MRACAVCLLALVLVTGARAFTVDCNAEYADCDSEIKKSVDESHGGQTQTETEGPTTTQLMTESPTDTPAVETHTKERSLKFQSLPRPKLLHLLDDSGTEAGPERSKEKITKDLADINLDSEEHSSDIEDHEDLHHRKVISDSFFSNLQAPFHALMNQEDPKLEAVDCKDHNEVYVIGERIERGCDETCECMSTGLLECSPRCKHPYIRRGRKLNDPLCFESPVDECCSIIACTTGENRGDTPDVCRYHNQTFNVGEKWNDGCEQVCSCEVAGTVQCKPRCKFIPQKENCINVQDPKDHCCELQVCDVSNDDHEEPSAVVEHSTLPMTTMQTLTTTMEDPKAMEDVFRFTSKALMSHPIIKTVPQQDYSVQSKSRDPASMSMSQDSAKNNSLSTKPTYPRVSEDSIGSIKVLQNNSVQVNLIHMNSTSEPVDLMLSSDGGKTFKDIELNYSNLLLNLEGGKNYILKAKESGANFNFSITASDSDAKKGSDDASSGKGGCLQDGILYAVGEEFHIGCTKLCECTAPGVSDCVPLVCPSHVGIELMAKGCVKWAPNPPPQPPNCCPRIARCLSDGSCTYKGTPIPNWSEVPITLTGCEKRCFCENGELDCQDVCSPLPVVPPQTLRCPPGLKPAPVNISDEDCCKQWGCVSKVQDTPGAGDLGCTPTPTGTTLKPLKPLNATWPTTLMNTATSAILFKNISSQTRKISESLDVSSTGMIDANQSNQQDENITVFTLDDYSSPIKTIYPDKFLASIKDQIKQPLQIAPQQLPQASAPVPPPAPPPIPPRVPLQIAPHIAAKSSMEEASKIIEHQKYSDREHIPKLEFAPELNIAQYYQEIRPKHLDNKNNLFKMIHDYQGQLIKKVSTPHKKKERPRLQIKYEPTQIPTKNSNYQYNNLFEPFPYLNAIDNSAYSPKPNENTAYNPKYTENPVYSPKHIENKAHNPKFIEYSQYSPKHIENSAYITKNIDNMPHTPKYTDNTAYNSKHKLEPVDVEPRPQNEQNSSKNLSGFRSSDIKLIIPVYNYNDDNIWSPDIKSLIPIRPQDISKAAIKPVKIEPFSAVRKSQNMKNMQLEDVDNLELLSQLESESEINRNLGRSADDKKEVTKMGEHAAQNADSPSSPSNPPFLPTIPPEIHFPQEDKHEYIQNNLNRPGIGLETPASGLPTELHAPQNYRPENRKLTVITIHADSPTSVKMLFGLPAVLVGLRGSVDLRYTDTDEGDVTKWNSQVFAPADEILSTPRLEFRLTGLKPSTNYKIRGKLYLHNLAVEPESDVYSVRTLDLPTVVQTEEKRREIDTRLTVMDSNDTSAHISWRHFSEEELQFIDGIQVRYRPVGTPIYSMTELLHHSRSNAELHDLRPGSRYEASLVLVPPPKATTELHDPGRVEFTTSPYIDPYNWSVNIEARAVGSEAAELTWHGVPSPAERWVRVYRAAHACGGSRKEHDAFRLATRDIPPSLTLTNLEPNMRCRVWLELFLTNGKVKTSNVLEINTKSVKSGQDPIDNMIEASSIAGSRNANRGDYYGALVVVGVVAALGALTSLLLLLVVLRRHRPRSVPITPVPNAPRESSLPPYDNPAYKLELQQETVDL